MSSPSRAPWWQNPWLLLFAFVLAWAITTWVLTPKDAKGDTLIHFTLPSTVTVKDSTGYFECEGSGLPLTDLGYVSIWGAKRGASGGLRLIENVDVTGREGEPFFRLFQDGGDVWTLRVWAYRSNPYAPRSCFVQGGLNLGPGIPDPSFGPAH